jgi:hypothetical protein
MGVPITIYHGSARVVDGPRFGWGRRYNDFGLGFYCTEDKDVAKEWAVSSLRGGFANRYTLDTENLSVLNLNDPEYTVLNWMAILVGHRLFSMKTPVAVRARRYLLERFGVNVGAYDLIYGCRADDAYFAFAQAFLNNTITVGQLSQGIRPESCPQTPNFRKTWEDSDSPEPQEATRNAMPRQWTRTAPSQETHRQGFPNPPGAEFPAPAQASTPY